MSKSKLKVTKKDAGDAVEFVGDNWRTILFAGVAVAGVVLLTKVTKAASGALDTVFNPGAKTQAELDANARKALASLSAKGIRPSYMDLDYSNWAIGLMDAFNPWNIIKYGLTDEKTVYSIFAYMKNDADIVKLFQAFGLHRLTLNPLKFGNLSAWIYQELDRKERGILNDELRQKGIKFTF